MSTTNEISQFRETLKDLREKMLKMLKMCEGRDFKQGDALEILNNSLINLIDIKSLNKQIQGEVESIKDFLNNEKEKVEEKNLQLQNNMYQKENIVSQINSCINFPTTEMNKIQMPTKYEVMEFYKEKAIHKPEADLKLMDYLECELEIRKKLNEKVNDSQKEKEENITKLKDFEKFYSDLPKYLENLETSTLKSQNYLNLNFNEKNKNLDLSGKLPPPLFILYNLLQCFSDDAIESEVNIKGREAKVDEFYSKYSSFFDCYLNRNPNSDNINDENEDGDTRQKEEGEHSEGEIEDEEAYEKKNANKKKKKKKKNFFNDSLNYGKAADPRNTLSEEEAEFKKIVSKLANKDEKLSKFPLYVEFKIIKNKLEKSENTENNRLYPMSFNFYFIPVVNLISVEIVNQQISSNNKVINLIANEENTISMSLNTNQILFNIFHPPSTLLTMIKDKIEVILAECCAEFGKTEKVFDFLQILTNNSLYNSRGLKDFCRLYFNYKSKKNKSVLNISFENSSLENPLNSFEIEPNQLNFYSNYFDNTNSINVDNFITRIKDRLYYLPLLLSQVDYLLRYLSLKEEILSEFKNEKKFQIVKEKTKITNARRTPKIEFYSKQEEINNTSNETVKFSSIFNSESSEKIYEKLSCSNKNLDVEAIYLCVEFERKNYKIKAYAEIRYDFPNQAPRFVLTMESTKNASLNIPGELMEFVNKENNLEDFKAENCGFSYILREIENEVNEYCLEDLLRNEKLIGWVFSYQIRTIQMCIDIFADRENSKYNAYFASENSSNKRKRPFLFSNINSSFHN